MAVTGITNSSATSNSVTSSQVSTQLYAKEVSEVANALTEIIFIYNNRDSIFSLMEETELLKYIYNALDEIKIISNNLDNILEVENYLPDILLIKNSMSKLNSIFNNLGMYQYVYDKLPELLAVHNSLKDILNLGEYILNITATIKMLDTYELPKVSIVGSSWNFEIPKGETGLTPIPVFSFNELTGQLEYSVTYQEYSADIESQQHVSITSLEDTVKKASEFYISDIVTDEADVTTREYLEDNFENLLRVEVNSYMNLNVSDTINSYLEGYLELNFNSSVRNVVSEYLESHKEELKSTIPGPVGYSPIINFTTSADGNVTVLTNYTDTDEEPQQQTELLFNVKDILETLMLENNYCNSSSVSGETGGNSTIIVSDSNFSSDYAITDYKVSLGFVQKPIRFLNQILKVDDNYQVSIPLYYQIVGDIPLYGYLVRDGDVLESIKISIEDHSIILDGVDEEYLNLDFTVDITVLFEVVLTSEKLLLRNDENGYYSTTHNDILGAVKHHSNVLDSDSNYVDTLVSSQGGTRRIEYPNLTDDRYNLNIIEVQYAMIGV
jgi:hypothetical protein